MRSKRRINRALLRYMPDRLRFEVMRKNIRINSKWPSPLFEIKIASTEYELCAAYRLLHDSYVKSGFMNSDPTGMRVLSQHLLPHTTTIVAKWEGNVIGTLSLIRDNPFGLPMEKIFDVDHRRQRGRRLAEVSSLAVNPKFRGQVSQALFPLFRYVYQYAKGYFGIHEFVIAVNPSMVDLYLAFMCFERLKAEPRPYEFVKGAPAVGLFLNFENAVERLIKDFAHRPSQSNFYKYWTEVPADPGNQLPTRVYRSASDPVITPELMKELFLEKAQLGQRLTFKEVQILLELYPYPNFQKVLQPLLIPFSRKSVRFETQMHAKVGAQQAPAEVLNVSREGLLLRMTADNLAIGQKVDIKVWLNENCSTHVLAETRWCPKDSLYGLKILEANDEWRHMVDTLEKEFQRHASRLSIAA